MLDKTQTIEKLRSTREYLGEHYGVHSMMLFGSLAKGLQHEGSDVDICVEGIESKEQYEVLEGMKVRMVQGYYFDKPMPKEEFEAKYL